MRAFLVSSLSIMTLLFCSTASADLTGSWSYKTSGSWKKGVCPIGKDGPGKIKVTKKGN